MILYSCIDHKDYGEEIGCWEKKNRMSGVRFCGFFSASLQAIRILLKARNNNFTRKHYTNASCGSWDYNRQDVEFYSRSISIYYYYYRVNIENYSLEWEVEDSPI